MNQKKIKTKIAILLLSSTILTLFGVVEDITSWMFVPLKCYSINAKSKTLIEDKASRDICVDHVYYPYQKKQGSVKLGLTTKLSNGNTLYTITTFWIAKDLGKDKFSDAVGDFTTHEMRIYNKYGVMTLNKKDFELPNKVAPYNIKTYKKYCEKNPILLNGLFLDEECENYQKLIWEKIQVISPTLFTNKSEPLSLFIFDWVSSNPYKTIGIAFLLIVITRILRKNQINKIHRIKKSNIIIMKTILEKVRNDSSKIKKFAILTTIICVFGFVLNSTLLLRPTDLLCLSKENANKLIAEDDDNNELKVMSVCVNEILQPFNPYHGQMKLGLIIKYQDFTEVMTETVMFVQLQENFQDEPGDMMHSKINYYGKNGILIKTDSELVMEQVINLMPNNADKEIWELVKNKLTNKKEIMYLSVQRILSGVVEDSLPFMFAAYSLLYSYSLYLTLVFDEETKEEENNKPED